MAQTLYAALGGSANSDLYTVDPATGAMTSIGPIGYAVTGMATDPTDGTMYGSTSNQSPSDPRSIITIDLATGAGTLVGPLGLGGSGHPAADIAFASGGQLYGWIEGQKQLATINKATGAGTLVGSPPFLSTFGDGMSFDSGDVLWACFRGTGNPIYTVDTSTSTPTEQSTITGAPCIGGLINAASFDASDVFWVVIVCFSNWSLATIDVNTGAVSDIGSMDASTDALAWGPGGTSPTVIVFDGAALHRAAG